MNTFNRRYDACASSLEEALSRCEQRCDALAEQADVERQRRMQAEEKLANEQLKNKSHALFGDIATVTLDTDAKRCILLEDLREALFKRRLRAIQMMKRRQLDHPWKYDATVVNYYRSQGAILALNELIAALDGDLKRKKKCGQNE